MANRLTDTFHPSRPVRYGQATLLGCLMLFAAVACRTQLTVEETAFYERARQIKSGTSLERVTRDLGKPARVLDAEPACTAKGGNREWLYDSVETPEGRKPLRAGTFSFCADRAGNVLAVFEVVE
jgi:hypothetical protein